MTVCDTATECALSHTSLCDAAQFRARGHRRGLGVSESISVKTEPFHWRRNAFYALARRVRNDRRKKK